MQPSCTKDGGCGFNRRRVSTKAILLAVNRCSCDQDDQGDFGCIYAGSAAGHHAAGTATSRDETSLHWQVTHWKHSDHGDPITMAVRRFARVRFVVFGADWRRWNAMPRLSSTAVRHLRPAVCREVAV
jgi:hypothetical protein